MGLPLGVIALGVGSVAYTHFLNDPGAEPEEEIEKRNTVAGMMRSEISTEDLRRSLGILAGDIGERHFERYESLRTAALWIESTLGPNNLGYAMRRQTYQVEGRDVWNVIAELPGTSRADEVVVVGAHYDTVPECPGANDNGTGVVAAMALAKAFAGSRNARTLQVVAFVNEEPPYYKTDEMGSAVFARDCRQSGIKIAGMLCLETMGCYSDEPGSQKYPPGLEGHFPEAGNFIALVGNETSRSLVEAVESAYAASASSVPALAGAFPEEIEGVGWSDHWSFWRAGYPALMATDTAPFRYAHYHQPEDTVDRIDFDRLAEVTRGLEAAVRALLNP
ncbi:MAG: M28 family peptidase [Verrucomicrobiae bacterium]|nr:M28 family peptidase [Verrucomicrobiae bacterium]